MACLAELKKSAAAGRNPQVLTMSPPLSMQTHWFQPHTAYTMAKLRHEHARSATRASSNALASA